MLKRSGPSADFSGIAPYYDHSRAYPESVLRAALQGLSRQGLLEPSSRVLDSGCGTGHLALPIARMGARVTGIDLSRGMIAIGRRQVPEPPSFVAADAQMLPFRAGCFDASVASKLFQHVGNWRLAAEEVLRVTNQSASGLKG